MKCVFTQAHAWAIAQKLDMDIESGRRHDLAVFRHDGKQICQYGIRRSSKEEPHNYIAKQLFLTTKDCKALHDCTLTKDEFIDGLKKKGLLQVKKTDA